MKEIPHHQMTMEMMITMEIGSQDLHQERNMTTMIEIPHKTMITIENHLMIESKDLHLEIDIITMIENHRDRLIGNKGLLLGRNIITMMRITIENRLLRGTRDLPMIIMEEEAPQIPSKL